MNTEQQANLTSDCVGGASKTALSEVTLRDYFAAKAMHAFIAISFDKEDVTTVLGLTPKAAYEMADAMLKARKS